MTEISQRNNTTIIIVTTETGGVEQECLQTLGYQVISVEHDGEKAVESILSHRPDVVLCDIFLPGMDALGILEAIQTKSYRGIFICVSAAPNDALAGKLMQSGAHYFLVKPFGFDYLAKRIDSLLENRYENKRMPNLLGVPQINDEYDLENHIAELMRQIGVPAHIRGYQYIRKGIMMSLKNRDLLNAITKELYPGIAKTYETTPSRVERAIRHAIEVAWTRGDVETLHSMFGYTVKTSKGKPTNGEFISMLTDYLRVNLKMG